MQYFTFHPSPPLDEVVDVFWMISHGDIDRRERILPSGTAEMVINLREDEIRIYDPVRSGRYARFSGAVVSGTYSRPFVCDVKQHHAIIGVHFRPGGALPFLGTPATELSNAHVNLEDLWGPVARILRARLCEAATVRNRFQIVEEALLERWHEFPARHPAIEGALQLFNPTATRTSTRTAARELGLSQRRFIQLFAGNVGLTPKLLCRILRFQRARTLAENAERSGGGTRSGRKAATIDWAETAVTCGYYDQSHLIKDFQDFSGLSPSQYIRQLRPARDLKDNHVPISR